MHSLLQLTRYRFSLWTFAENSEGHQVALTKRVSSRNEQTFSTGIY